MRYIGAKTELLGKIEQLLEEKGLLKKDVQLCDAFSGTSAVGEFFKAKMRVSANDIQYYAYVLARAKLNTPDLEFKRLGVDPFELFNQDKLARQGFIYNNYAPSVGGRMYFSDENAARIDFIRAKIEEWWQASKLNEDEYFYLLACLIESVSKVANVAGVYGAYLKTWDPRAVKKMKFIKVEQGGQKNITRSEVYNYPIETLIQKVRGDVLYLDPPYTATQYSSQYHILETIARYDGPVIAGKGGLRDTSTSASAWARRSEAEQAFEQTIANCNFKYVVMSYSSDGLMGEKYIEAVLKRYGKAETYTLKKIPYKKYINYHSTKDASAHCEYLFYVELKDKKAVNYASPLNYQGGKYDMVDFIKENLPESGEKMRHFVDLFGGGYNVGVNIEAERITYNDCNSKVAELMRYLYEADTVAFLKYLTKSIKRYGLEKGDKAAYVALREKYNAVPESKRDPRMLYLLILYGFHQQLRFNTAHDFNNPVGNSGFNELLMEKLVSFMNRMKTQRVEFVSGDFEETRALVQQDSFVYCDPPYLITLGSYNDGKRGFNGWNESDEKRLYAYLDELNARGVRFMLSNVIKHKELTNQILLEWIGKNNYHLIEYSGKGARGRKEILVTNYERRER